MEKEPVLLYSDEDKYENNTRCFVQPNIKHKFNLDLILSNNYICHLMFVRADVIKTLKLRKKYDGAQDYDLVLRVIGTLLENTKAVDLENQIVHIPKVLYHWRCHETQQKIQPTNLMLMKQEKGIRRFLQSEKLEN